MTLDLARDFSFDSNYTPFQLNMPLTLAPTPPPQQQSNACLCGLCNNEYKDPRLLACFHSFCLKCLVTFADGHHRLSCPTCGTKTELSPLGADGLLVDYSLEAAIQSTDSENSPTRSALDVANNNNVTSSSGKSSRACFCLEHRTQPLKFMCLTCNFVVCAQCINVSGDHPQPYHTIEAINDVSTAQLQQLRTLVTEVDSKRDDLCRKFTDIEEINNCVRDSVTQTKQRVQVAIDEMTQIIQEMGNVLIRDLELTGVHRMEQIRHTGEEVERAALKTLQTIIFSQRIFKYCTPTEILVFKPLIDARLRGFLSFKSEAEMILGGSIEIAPPNLQMNQVRQALESLTMSMRADTWSHSEFQDQSYSAQQPSTTPNLLPAPIGHPPSKSSLISGSMNNNNIVDDALSVANLRMPSPLKSDNSPIFTMDHHHDYLPRSLSSPHPLHTATLGQRGGGGSGARTTSMSPPLLYQMRLDDVPPSSAVQKQFDSLYSNILGGGTTKNDDNTASTVATRPLGSRTLTITTPPIGGSRQVPQKSLSESSTPPPPSQTTGAAPLSSLHQQQLAALYNNSSRVQIVKRQKIMYQARFGEFGVLEGQFTEPSGVAVNAQNDIIMADTNNHRIQVFGVDGIFKFQFGECGKRDGQLLYPNRVAVNRSTGDIIVTERSPTHQIQVYTQFGQFLRKFGANILQHPRGVCVDSQGRIVVVECKVMRVIIFDSYGNVVQKFSCARYLEFPNGVCTNDRNEIFISDNRAHCIKVFNYDGQYVRQIGGEGLTNYPIGVGINAFGEVVVADNHNNFNLTVFNQEGQLLLAMESKVKHAQCFDIALLDDGSVVLASKDYRLYLYRYQNGIGV